MFKDYTKGIKYTSVKKEKQKNKTKQKISQNPHRSVQMIFCRLAGLTCGCTEGSEGKLWDDLLRGGGCGAD